MLVKKERCDVVVILEHRFSMIVIVENIFIAEGGHFWSKVLLSSS